MLLRYAAGVLNELLKLVKEKKKVVDDREFQHIAMGLTEPAATAWRAVLGTASRQTPVQREFMTTLAYVRNNASFHYTALAEVAKAWRKVFQLDEKTAANSSAVYCLGNTMASTRFHFADATFQAILMRGAPGQEERASGGDRVDSNVVALAVHVNEALRQLIERFLHERGGPPQPASTGL
jgi:hypothetical protein